MLGGVVGLALERINLFSDKFVSVFSYVTVHYHSWSSKLSMFSRAYLCTFANLPEQAGGCRGANAQKSTHSHLAVPSTLATVSVRSCDILRLRFFGGGWGSYAPRAQYEA